MAQATISLTMRPFPKKFIPPSMEYCVLSRFLLLEVLFLTQIVPEKNIFVW